MNEPTSEQDRTFILALPDVDPDAAQSYNPSRVDATASMMPRPAAPAVPPFAATPPSPSRRPHESSGTSVVDLLRLIPDDKRFLVDTRIARGGIGEVWGAKQQALQRVLAIKRLREDRLGDMETHHRGTHPIEVAFYQEALLTANLEHPNIVPVYDLGVDEEGRMLLAMKLVRGTGWNDLIRTEFAKMEVTTFIRRHLRIMLEVCDAVTYAHSRGVVHRDLKPAQVMVGEYGEVQLMDWGLAVIFDTVAAKARIPLVMEAGAVPTTRDASNPAGTPAFMAPEQLDKNGLRIAPTTDVFLLGAILYQILCGHGPYSGHESRAAMEFAGRCAYLPVWERAKERFVPQELAALCHWAMSRNPADRPQTVRMFADHIQNYLDTAERRWESLDLTARVAEGLAAPRTDAKILASLMTYLDSAEGLWKENPEIQKLRSSVVAAFANHLTSFPYEMHVAISQANRLQDWRLRNFLVAHLERAWAERVRRRSFITHALAAIVILLVAIFVVNAWGAWRAGRTVEADVEYVE